MTQDSLPLKPQPCVYSIPCGHAFADSFAQGLLARAQGDALALSDYTLLLPTRRACRTLRDSFLKLTQGRALLLPRMHALGDVDAEEMSILMGGEQDIADTMDLPPAVRPLQRQLLLARAVMTAYPEQSFDQAAALALDLGRFLDEVQNEGLSFDGLKNLVPEQFSRHWQKTLSFLDILTTVWPRLLESYGVMDRAERRNRLIRAQIAAWKKFPPQGPVIAAGSTGTTPAAADLLCLVAQLPQGELVLPGLDTDIDDASWDVLAEDHPQYNLKNLLSCLRVDRRDVAPWPLGCTRPLNTHRVRLLHEAMRPADTTENWRRLTTRDIAPQALDGLTRIDCDTPQEEADLIALLMREALETPDKTVALVTPDRRLARRVTLALRRWGIQIDDSGGQPLTEMWVGAWLMLTAEMAQERLAPVTLLAFLKHPLMAAGLPADDLRAMVYLLDQLVLRGPRPSAGFAGLSQALAAVPERRAGERDRLATFIAGLEEVSREFSAMMEKNDKADFKAMLAAHLRLAERLADTTDTPGGDRLWRGEGGEAASVFLAELVAAAADVPPLQPSHYVALLANLLKGITVRPNHGSHPRLFILGQIEARLYAADKMILGGLNEGTWPALPAHDPWMSRPMRRAFGLPSPEKALSLAAHDFVQNACAPEVVLTRARKVDGTPTVPARWLLRIETVLHALGLDWPQAAALQYRQWLKDMDRPQAVTPVARPAPRPPAAARPRELSVTRIETWMRDPYQIYAQYVLKLRALDPIDADPGGAERGTFIHAALEKFVEAFPRDLPDDAEAQLLAFGRAALVDMHIPQEVEAFWWPRFEKIVVEFTAQEREWRRNTKPVATEISGRLPLADFTLTGKADRIDRYPDGSYAIVDYKTGAAPEARDVRQGISPQLPLEALMLQEGAFEAIAKGSRAQSLVYWKATGGGKTPVERIHVETGDHPVDQLVAEARDGLSRLVAEYAQESTPYYSQPRTAARPRYSDYDHLARVKEWGVSGDEGEGA